MGMFRIHVGFLALLCFGCLCAAQWPPRVNVQNPALPQAGVPTYVGTPSVPRPVVGAPSWPQAPSTPRPAGREPAWPQAPSAPRPVIQATARPPVGKPPKPQAPSAPRPVVQATARPQAPSAPRPPVGRPPKPQAPSAPRPVVPTPAVGLPAKAEVQAPQPVRPDVVKAFCGESSVEVLVEMDMFGTGHVVDPSRLTLGDCGVTGYTGLGDVLVFETELQGCGSTLTMTEDSLIYAFTLTYDPKPLDGTPIVRTNAAVVGIACHYMRLHNVSSNALNPTWIPYYSTMSAEEALIFSLRLMTDDWRAERQSNVFFLGDIMHIEAAVIQAYHIPLRVFVDSCVATLVPDLDAVPKYPFIYEHGCMMDAKLTGSRSKFLPRVQDDKLYIQLDAFRFFQDARSSIYIICHLKATAASAATDSEYKACSFSAGANRWMAAGGNDQVCGCCDTSCSGRKGRSVEDSALLWEGDAKLGPIIVQQPAAYEAAPESQSSPLKAEDHVAEAVSPAVVVLAGVVAAVGLACVVVLATLLFRRRKPV